MTDDTQKFIYLQTPIADIYIEHIKTWIFSNKMQKHFDPGHTS